MLLSLSRSLSVGSHTCEGCVSNTSKKKNCAYAARSYADKRCGVSARSFAMTRKRRRRPQRRQRRPRRRWRLCVYKWCKIIYSRAAVYTAAAADILGHDRARSVPRASRASCACMHICTCACQESIIYIHKIMRFRMVNDPSRALTRWANARTGPVILALCYKNNLMRTHWCRCCRGCRCRCWTI